MASLPPSLRFVNRVGRAWRAAGRSPRRIQADTLVAEAQRQAGRADLGDPTEYRTALEVITQGLEHTPHLSTVGRFSVRRQLVGALAQRAVREAWRERAPERFQTPLRTPLVIVGLPRTGTTFLHHLLSAPSDTRSLAMWEVARPFPPVEGPDRRQTINKRAANWVLGAMPDFADKHDTGRDAPEECMHLMNQAFFAWTYWSVYDVPGYRDWLTTADATPAYRIWSDVLRFHQHDTPQRRFVLKSPSHAAHLDALIEAVPEARVVFAHRDVTSVVPSFASLLTTLRGATHLPEHIDRRSLGTEALAHLGWAADRARALRDRVPSHRRIDVHFDELRSTPLAVAERIHRAFDLPWTPDVEAAVSGVIAAKSGRRSSGHRYSADDFGLTDRAITDRIPPLA